MRSSGRVRQGGLRHAPADTVGSSSMTITEALALFAALWASILKRNGFRLTQVRDKTKTARIEELQVQQTILLYFFFLVGAEHGEIEVRLASGATRQRSRFPCPLGRGSSAGPGRPRPSCRSSVRRSRGICACHGRACGAARRLLTRLPLRYVLGLAKTPSWWSWGLHLWQAS